MSLPLLSHTVTPLLQIDEMDFHPPLYILTGLFSWQAAEDSTAKSSKNILPVQIIPSKVSAGFPFSDYFLYRKNRIYTGTHKASLVQKLGGLLGIKSNIFFFCTSPAMSVHVTVSSTM